MLYSIDITILPRINRVQIAILITTLPAIIYQEIAENVVIND